MAYDPYKALYIHIPFCASRCAYCDFTTSAIKKDSLEIDAYIENLVQEIRRATHEGKLGSIETIYIGGGTPSFIGNARLSSLMYALSLSINFKDVVECSMEANPESIDERMINDIWALGVNRLSIGVQSFDDDMLAFLERPHNASHAKDAIARAKERFENVSIDLICGVPGLRNEVWEQSVCEAIKAGVTHVSIYPLTIEDKTPLYKRMMAGEIPVIDEDESAHQMELAEKLLVQAGFARYEVASYAKPGFECKHNEVYWQGRPYIGFGTSAVTMTQNNKQRVRVQDKEIVDELNQKQMCAEDLMLGMRLSCGISKEKIAEARSLLPDVDGVLDDLQSKGLVEFDARAYKPTELGWLCGNDLYEALLNLAP